MEILYIRNKGENNASKIIQNGAKINFSFSEKFTIMTLIFYLFCSPACKL